MKNSKLFILLLCGIMHISLFSQTQINPYMFGQNAWEIAKGTPLNGNSQPLVPGQLDNLFADISASGVKYMRIGGIDVNFFPLYQFNGSTQAITNAAWLEHLID